MGIIQIILNNLDILAIGLGVGLAVALIIYYYNIIFKKDQARAMEPVKDLAIVVFYFIMLFALDYSYNLFLSNWLGLSNIQPGYNLRIAEAVIYKDIDKFRESLVYVYLADFMITLLGGFQAHIHAALNPDMSLLAGTTLFKRIPLLSEFIGGKNSLDPYKAEVSMNFFSNFISALQILYTASYGLFLVLVYKYVKLTIITYLPLLMSIFVPLSLLLIFFPITRKVGLTIIGLSVTLYYLFPVFVIYSDSVLRNMPDFDYRYISSYISPTIVEFLDRNPVPNNNNIGYKYAFLEREKKISSNIDEYFIKPGQDDSMTADEDNKIANSSKEMIGVMYVYNFVDTQSLCDYNTDKEICREFETVNIGDYKSENSLAPVASLYGNMLKYAAIARTSAALKELIQAAGAIGVTNPILIIIKNVVNIAVNLAVNLIFMSQLLPIPVLSHIVYGLFQIPFIPFLVFKTILEVSIIVYKTILYGSLTVFLDIFLIITGYRAIASIIGAEQRILGLEKVL